MNEKRTSPAEQAAKSPGCTHPIVDDDEICIRCGVYAPLDGGDVEEKGAIVPATTPANIPPDLLKRLKDLGIVGAADRSYNVGASNYSEHVIQPWSIWLDYDLDPWDADIVKRVLRTKMGDSRITDYEKIIHICKEKIRQITSEASADPAGEGL